jgi:hypothetical protein
VLERAFFTPRPEPSHLLPAVASAAVLALALPVFVVSGWRLGGWALAAVIWAGAHALDLVVARSRTKAPMQIFSLLFKSLGLLIVLFAAVAADRHLALAAVLTYALAYTCELGLSLASYFGATR